MSVGTTAENDAIGGPLPQSVIMSELEREPRTPDNVWWVLA